MVRKAIIILLTILTAFTVFSAGYGMWERKLVIKGCIEVNQPDSTAPANDTTKIVRPIDLKARDDHQSDKSDQGEETNTDGNVNQPEVKDQSGDNGEQPTDTEDQSTDNGEQPADTEDQSADNEEQPADTEDQSGDDGEQPADAQDQSGDNGEQPADTEDQSEDDGESPADSDGQSIADQETADE
jgi:hypothetical protein